jgi:hypothetical protein
MVVNILLENLEGVLQVLLDALGRPNHVLGLDPRITSPLGPRGKKGEMMSPDPIYETAQHEA